LAETDSSGALKATYTYDDKGNPLAMRRGGAPYYYQTNSHGDVISLTNSSGQIVNTYTYDPWGKLLTQNETVENPFRYQGSVYDSETGLYYLMSRYYDPNTCRFLSRDALDLSNMANPLQLNRYAYCLGNPVYFTDKSGQTALASAFEDALRSLGQRIISSINMFIKRLAKSRSLASQGKTLDPDEVVIPPIKEYWKETGGRKPWYEHVPVIGHYLAMGRYTKNFEKWTGQAKLIIQNWWGRYQREKYVYYRELGYLDEMTMQSESYNWFIRQLGVNMAEQGTKIVN